MLSHHYKKTSLFPDGGAAAQYPGEHHDGPRTNQDEGRSRVGAGGQKADVVAFIHQSPYSHCHHSATCQLGGWGTVIKLCLSEAEFTKLIDVVRFDALQWIHSSLERKTVDLSFQIHLNNNSLNQALIN